MRNLSFFVCLLLLCQTGFAATSFKDLLNEYQYNVTVEWDQQDAEALKKYEKEFQAGLQNLITEGHSSESLLLEAVSALPSELSLIHI